MGNRTRVLARAGKTAPRAIDSPHDAFTPMNVFMLPAGAAASYTNLFFRLKGRRKVMRITTIDAATLPGQGSVAAFTAV
jgi:hypothetical protein